MALSVLESQQILEGLDGSTDDFLSNGFHQFYNEFHDEVLDFELVDIFRNHIQAETDHGFQNVDEVIGSYEDCSNSSIVYPEAMTTTITWIDSSYLDLDNIVTELPFPAVDLPDVTPLCNESCSHFIKESSENLRYSPDVQVSTMDSKPLQCTFEGCGKFYAKPTHLKAHLKRHMNEKPYICGWPDCKWRFSRSDELARHRRSHLGIKPYKCCFCPKAFARSDHLTKHRRVHEKKFNAVNKDLKIQWPPVPKGRPGRKPKTKKLI